MSLTIEITSVPDRDELVAEIWQEDVMVAEIQRAPNGFFILEVYPSPDQKPWTFDLQDWIKTLSAAQTRLG